MMNPDMEKRITPEEYDKCTSLFVSEFGYIGAPCQDTILTYMDGAPLDQEGATWQHHTNTFEKRTVLAGIKKHYLPTLSGPNELDLDDYVLYSGLCQGLMYSYSLESMRYNPACHGGLFWMYNDCWGEVGWTIIDYCLRRKPAWYFVRRTFAPLRLILRPQGDEIRVVLANDTRSAASFELETGYVSLDGSIADLARRRVEAPPLARTELAVFPRGDHDPLGGLWIARSATPSSILPAIFRATDTCKLRLSEPGLRVSTQRDDQGLRVGVNAKRYAHAVHIDLPAGALPEDDYFDLLPGETRWVRIFSAEPVAPETVRVSCVNQS